MPYAAAQETVKKHGADQVQIWRRSFDIPPPDIDESSEFNPAKELVKSRVLAAFFSREQME